jgi:hypothetical protein
MHFCITQYFCPTPQTWETRLHPKRWLLVVSGRWSIFPSVSWGRPEFEPRFLSVWWAVLQKLVPVPHWVLLCIWGPHPNSPGGWIPLWIKLSIGTWWDLLQVVQGMHPSDKGGDNLPYPQSQQTSPHKMLWEIMSWHMWHWGRWARSNILLYWHRPSRLVFKGWAL